MLPLFATTMFVSAALLFAVQPMFARMVLPLLGGAPSVWNTVMVFYQVALLAGYGYAHTLGRRGSTWWFAHLIVMSGALLLLPLRLAGGHVPPAGGNPVAWLLWTMTTTVGPPFLLVATTGPLVQRWFAHAGHAHSRDPYFLYAASNVGSILGLLAYPFVLEPGWSLASQSRIWTVGYGLLILLLGACAITARRGPARDATAEDGPTRSDEPLAWGQRLRWVMLAFVPSSLMLGVTTHLSMDLVAVPLLWIIPLTIYLLTFIIAFARRSLIPDGVLSRIRIYTMLGVLIVLVSGATEPIRFVAGLHLVALFAVGLTCHLALARSRPPVVHLTEFYVWVAVGGALGGAFNALLAPVLFHSVAEYPLVLILACLLAPALPAKGKNPGTLRTDLIAAATFTALLAATVLMVHAFGHAWRRSEFIVLVALLCFPLFAFRRRPVRFGLAFGGVLLVSPLAGGSERPMIHAERSFFGIHRIQAARYSDGAMYRLVHGTTVHGMQWIEPRRCDEPLSYYHRLGPAGQAFEALAPAGRMRAVGVVGLGTGALSAYSRPDQEWTYFEIDPAVARIAANPAWFCYLERSPAAYRVLLGDARLSLAADTTRYDLLVLDAYSSDAIPVHLLTREAFAQYFGRLTPHGVLLVHLSNIHFDLAPVVSAIARDARLPHRIRSDGAGAARDAPRGFLPSTWAVVAREAGDLGPLAHDPRWQEPRLTGRSPLWTDDYSSLVSALR